MSITLHKCRLVFYASFQHNHFSSAPRIRYPGRPNKTCKEKIGSAKIREKGIKKRAQDGDIQHCDRVWETGDVYDRLGDVHRIKRRLDDNAPVGLE